MRNGGLEQHARCPRLQISLVAGGQRGDDHHRGAIPSSSCPHLLHSVEDVVCVAAPAVWWRGLDIDVSNAALH